MPAYMIVYQQGVVRAVILMEFPTVDAAMAWYNSPAYQAVLAHRKKAADFQVTIVEGL